MTTLTDDQIAARLYPTMVKPEQQQQRTEQQEQTETRHEHADPVQAHALQELDAMNRLYGEQAYSHISLLDPTEHLDKTTAEIEEQNAVFRDHCWALQLPDPNAQELVSILRAAERSPPTEEQQAEWAKQTRETLVARHGQDGARQRIALVQKYLGRTPELAKRIADAGLLQHPRLAEVAHELAWSHNLRGLL